MARRSTDPAVARLAAELLEQLDRLAGEIATHIAEQIEVYGAETLVDRAELTRSLSHNLTHILGQLSGLRPPDYEAPRQIGRSRAAQDMPLAEILRAYRLGFSLLWQRLLDSARQAGTDTTEALLDTATTIWELADEYSVVMTDAYRQAMSERLIAADRRRSGLVAALLGERVTIDRSAWEIAKLLELPYEGTFLVIAVGTPPDDAAGLPQLEDRLRGMQVASAWRAQPDQQVAVLSLGSRRTVDQVVAVMASSVSSAEARIGVSPPFMRLDGALNAARYAQVALDALPPGTSGIRQLEDSPLTDLLVRDRDATSKFVQRVLHKALALPDDDRWTLLETAEAWVSARGSAAEAGRVLYCHENTVRHRMHRLEEHLGVSLDDPRDLADLTAALHAIRTFPELGQRS